MITLLKSKILAIANNCLPICDDNTLILVGVIVMILGICLTVGWYYAYWRGGK